MREFFRPLRRKLGAATLSLACVFMAGWIRSLTEYDAISLRSFDGARVLSGSGQLFFVSAARGSAVVVWQLLPETTRMTN